MSWLQSIKDLKYLLFLLVPVGIYLIVIGIKKSEDLPRLR